MKTTMVFVTTQEREMALVKETAHVMKHRMNPRMVQATSTAETNR
jgi:hypothetical protein